MRIPLVIFDFDGTMVRTLPLAMEIFNQLAPVHNFQPIQDFEALRSLPTKAFFRQQGIRIWKLGRFVKGFQEEMQKRAQEIQPVQGLPEVLANLRKDGHRLGILSSNAELHIRERLRFFGIEDCFELISSYPKLFGKAKMLKRISKTLDISRAEVAYIGDEYRDMEAARKAGVRPVAVSWGYHSSALLSDAKPEVIVDTPAALLEWIQRENR
ncbi:HAD-IA family hydrolase [Telmatocola sphagniphila]|uniref:HAD-IA family hydrolase n=1 Tax=Telmatocola sphagniphila TaxID=1123043 RepID=A0A8E6B8X1_9BACT|nr:HAD-IA family hydrolase [Telmatocola sphagniphila]QVL32555.1 HAD-IA family hydrolase [Telmatocola sphagniphila]